MLGKAIKMNLEDLWPFLAIEGACFLVYELIEAIILYVGKPDTSGAICGVILLAIGVMANLIAGGTYPVLNVDLLLRYSVTRKTALFATLSSMTLNVTVSMACAALLGWVDGRIARLWVNVLPWVTEVESVEPPLWAYFVIGIGVVCLAMGAGAMLQKFGRKAFWLVWALWMLFVVGINLVDMEAIIEAPATIPALVALCVVSLIGGSALTLRSTVRN